MPAPDPSFGWEEATVAFAVTSAAAFLLAWVVTDLLRVRRSAYVAILAVSSFALAGGYLAWSGTSADELLASDAGWALLAGAVAAGVVAPLVRRLPSGPHPRGARLGAAVVWEGIVYGSAEALLLATLPVLTLWQAMSDLGWASGGWSKVWSGFLAVGGALLVVLLHHLGYEEFRARSARPKLLGALVTCGLQAVAFLLTGSVLAPLVAHIALHVQMLVRGVQLPPVAATIQEDRSRPGPSELPQTSRSTAPAHP